MFHKEITKLLAQHIPLTQETILDLIEVPPNPEMGDYAFPCFALARELKKAPPQIAAELAQKIELSGNIKELAAQGPYLNIFIAESAWAKELLAQDSLSFWKFATRGKKILIEYPSPNTNKPLHLGHVRNMVIGSTLVKLLSTSGNEVIPVNLNNDRGIHICKSMLAYQKWGEKREPDKKSDHFVGDWYVKFAQEANEELQAEAQAMLQAWEAGDPAVRALWEKMNGWAFNGWQETYDRFGITFAKQYYESNIYTQGKELVLANIPEVFEKDESGAVFANLEEYKLPNKYLLRKDGTTLYMTQDVAFTIKKQQEWNPDKQIWVVGNEQELHFQQLFAILDKLGRPIENFYHLNYGMVELPEGKMKSREGTVVDADDLLDEMEFLAAEQVRERHDDWPEEKVNEVAKWLAMGAIRFFMNKYDPARNFVFDPKSSLSFEGDTGPYVQYTHARICSILKRAGKIEDANNALLTTPEEIAVCKQLIELPKAFLAAVSNYKPHLIAQQLLDCSRAINTFYHAHPVLQADEDIKNARLALLLRTQQILEQGLDLLGIHAPDEM